MGFGGTANVVLIKGGDKGYVRTAILRDDNNSVDAYFFGHLKIPSIANVSIGGGQAAAQPECHGSSILQNETLGRRGRRSVCRLTLAGRRRRRARLRESR